eukprot:comp18071_c0_seq1/m.18662 comp18071_c0_seq1/g.18662  ORF comp18071_c0_seq1/g.18662 comp18071_c0_seq1/m.18662 type:complete len:585 (-) comp18071_c0_seq1:660-2414(-)
MGTGVEHAEPMTVSGPTQQRTKRSAAVDSHVVAEVEGRTKRPNLTMDSHAGNVADLAHPKLNRTGMTVTREVVARIPTTDGVFSLVLYSNNRDEKEHLAIVVGPIDRLKEHGDLMVRVHCECFTGEVMGSLRCDCGEQLRTAMYMVAEREAGVIVFLRQEGRGIGLKDKLKAYNLQDKGYDTVEANLMLGHQADERNYEVAALILEDLGLSRFLLLTNNPLKTDALTHYGLNVHGRVGMNPTQISADTMRYLTTKVQRMQHALSLESLTINPVPSRPTSTPVSPTLGRPPNPLPRPTTDGGSANGEKKDGECAGVGKRTGKSASEVKVPQVYVTNNYMTNITNNIYQAPTQPAGPFSSSYLDAVSGVVGSARGRPFVTLTYAQSLDGSIATVERRPMAISGPQSMQMTHKLRADHAAILVGVGTVIADNPRLTVRLVPGTNPRPVVLDTHLRIPLTSQLLTNELKPWIVCAHSASEEKAKELESLGARVLRAAEDKSGQLSIGSVLSLLGHEGVTSLMVEGGATVIQSFLASQLVDVCIVTIAPTFAAGLRPLEGQGHKLPRLENIRTHQLGRDVVIVGTPVWD